MTEVEQLREQYAMYNRFYNKKNLSYKQYKDLRDKMNSIADQLEQLVECEDCKKKVFECECAF